MSAPPGTAAGTRSSTTGPASDGPDTDGPNPDIDTPGPDIDDPEIDDGGVLQPGAAASSTDSSHGSDGPLGPHVLCVLSSAGAKLEQISGRRFDPAMLQTNPGTVKDLLTLISAAGGAALRTAGRAALSAELTKRGQQLTAPDLTWLGDPDSSDEPLPCLSAPVDLAVAVALCSPETDTVELGARRLRTHLAEARRARRRERRRATSVPVEQRAAERERTRLEHLRDKLDRSATRTATLEAERAQLSAQVSDLLGDVATLRARLQSTELRLAAARTDAHSVPRLAGTLSSVLLRAATPPAAAPAGPASTGSADDSARSVPLARHPAEAPPLPEPGDAAARAEQQALIAQVSLAAERAGLPTPLAERAADWLPTLLAALAAPPPLAQVTAELNLTVDVLGGGTEVGGSCVLVTAGDTRILIDAGSRPGNDDGRPRRLDVALRERLDAIVVTHAHNDHAGWVPAVVAAQSHVPVLTTEATSALLAVMWTDSAKVMSRRAQDHANDSTSESGPAPLPPYTRADVTRALSKLRSVQVGSRIRIGQLHLELFPAGHIVGAVGVVVHAGSQRVVISGDVSRPGQKSVGGIVVPESARGAELMLLETTYARAGKRMPRAKSVEQFVRDIAGTVEAGGTVLVPAFALGRAQEVALVLAEHLPEVDVLVDGLARSVCEIYDGQLGPDGEPLTLFGGRVKPVPSGQTQAEITRMRPGVVVATSGMLHGGPAVSWARKILPDPRHRLMIVGYQDEESPGARLAALAVAGGGAFDLPNSSGILEPVPVHATVGTYGLGAHAEADELVAISAEVRPGELMLVHGDLGGQREFAERMRLRSQPTMLADQVWQPTR